jgi:hypothetical protein
MAVIGEFPADLEHRELEYVLGVKCGHVGAPCRRQAGPTGLPGPRPTAGRTSSPSRRACARPCWAPAARRPFQSPGAKGREAHCTHASSCCARSGGRPYRNASGAAIAAGRALARSAGRRSFRNLVRATRQGRSGVPALLRFEDSSSPRRPRATRRSLSRWTVAVGQRRRRCCSFAMGAAGRPSCQSLLRRLSASLTSARADVSVARCCCWISR